MLATLLDDDEPHAERRGAGPISVSGSACEINGMPLAMAAGFVNRVHYRAKVTRLRDHWSARRRLTPR